MYIRNGTEESPISEEQPQLTDAWRAEQLDESQPTLQSQNQLRSTIIYIMCIIIFLSATAVGLFQIPLTALIEDAVCHGYYNQVGRNGLPLDGKKVCKENAIQSKLASVLGVSSALDAFVGFLVVLPWGIATDM